MPSSPPPKNSRKFFPVVLSSYVFLRRGEEVLLVRRANTGYRDGMYGLPAGHVEAGEGALVAAIRETQEEVGVTLAPEDLKLVHTMHRRCGDHERIDFFFEATRWGGEVVNAEPEKHDEVAFYPLKSLPENIVPYLTQAIEHHQSGKPYSEYDETENFIFTKGS